MGKIEIENFDNYKVFNLSGQFTGGPETDEFYDEMVKVDSEKLNLIVNFDGCNYLSSIAIGILVKMHAKFSESNLKLIFCGFNQTLENVLKMTKVLTILNVEADLEAAKKKML